MFDLERQDVGGLGVGQHAEDQDGDAGGAAAGERHLEEGNFRKRTKTNSVYVTRPMFNMNIQTKTDWRSATSPGRGRELYTKVANFVSENSRTQNRPLYKTTKGGDGHTPFWAAGNPTASRRAARAATQPRVVPPSLLPSEVHKEGHRTTGHCAETYDFLTERAYALSSYALTTCALLLPLSRFPTPAVCLYMLCSSIC